MFIITHPVEGERQGGDANFLSVPAVVDSWADEAGVQGSSSIVRLFVLPGGGYLLGVWDNKTAQTQWWLHDGSLRPLPRPPAYTIGIAPILSNDGKWAAWLETIPAAGVTPRHQRVVIRSLDARAGMLRNSVRLRSATDRLSLPKISPDEAFLMLQKRYQTISVLIRRESLRRFFAWKRSETEGASTVVHTARETVSFTHF